ncbi:TauD/TfdA family dioxygenase [Chloroflexi bacterium TSY]|nr:TauD/TfdA family dioxygenase [Chloroflexi bacterium TSY]
MADIHISATGAALGADVSRLDLKEPLSATVVEHLQNAFYQYCVLRFRNQSISKADLVGFSHYFGEPLPHPTNIRNRDPDYPQVTIISNIHEQGKAIGALGNAEIRFHADLVFLHTPSSISLLYCVEAPEQGGDTFWTSGYAGYAALDDQTKSKIDGLVAVSVDPNLAFLAIFSRDCRDFGVIYSDFGYRKQPISYLKIAQI